MAGTFFKKRESHKTYYRSGQHKTEIDLFLGKRQRVWRVTDCKIIASEHVVTQHKIIASEHVVTQHKIIASEHVVTQHKIIASEHVVTQHKIIASEHVVTQHKIIASEHVVTQHKIIASEHVVTQHKPLVLFGWMQMRKEDKVVGRNTIKWWKCSGVTVVAYKEMLTYQRSCVAENLEKGILINKEKTNLVDVRSGKTIGEKRDTWKMTVGIKENWEQPKNNITASVRTEEGGGWESLGQSKEGNGGGTKEKVRR